MGFDSAKFLTSVGEDKKCLLCHGVLDNPVKSPCGHVFCYGCILPWLVTRGECPEKCRAVSQKDLESVVPLREVILNLRVKCEFLELGCTETIRLTDLLVHTQTCVYQPVACSNPGCAQILPLRELFLHQSDMCAHRPVGHCDKGCGIVLYLHTLADHDCLYALKALLASHKQRLLHLEHKLTMLTAKFAHREKSLSRQVTTLSKQLVEQKIIGDLNKSKNMVSSHEEVNGQDLSQSTHHEAVEVFRSANEPIVVEVLRRRASSAVASCSTGMKTQPVPTMVSIATQTEEEFYCHNRPPTPPPGFYPIPGLYQPSSRRPVAFSPSAEMGLTDIEMAHTFDIDDPYFDDRHYEMVYEEVLLRRASSAEKLGLTLCYGSLEDDLTDIFISEVDPCSIAGKDGRIREGDQIVQINGVDVRSRSEAISLFSGHGTDISLTVARAQLQCDDGFLEEPNMVLDDLHMDLLEKQHQDNMQFMASMLSRRHLEEEGATTDTGTSSHRHEKDSGVGRTEESSEQETLDSESLITGCKFRHHSTDSYLSSDLPGDMHCAAAAHWSRASVDARKDSESSLERELSLLNREMDEIQVDCQDLVDSHMKEQQRLGLLAYNESVLRGDTQKSPRVVPRMGTRLEYSKHPGESALARKPAPVGSSSPSHTINNGAVSSLPPTCKSYTCTNPSSVSSTMSSTCGAMNSDTTCSSHTSTGLYEKDLWTTTSAYNTGESCRSTPLTLELNPAADEQPQRSASLLCLAATPCSGSSGLVTSDTEKQTQTPTKPRDYSSEDSGHGHPKGSSSSHTLKAFSIADSMKAHQMQAGESLQDLYLRCADVMYTNRANLQHTIAVQQKLFQQQLEQQARLRGHGHSPGHSNPGSGNDAAADSAKTSPGQTAPSDSGQMEWVVKRRPDGTRYITRRPVRSKLLKERAKKISEERCGLTTDDDAMSEMKTGRYWSKEDRKRHLEKAKDYKRKKELLAKAKMETLKETEEKKELSIVELSHRKMMKHKGKKVLDNFTTVKEMLAHGNKVSDGKTYNPLLSVTTV